MTSVSPAAIVVPDGWALVMRVTAPVNPMSMTVT